MVRVAGWKKHIDRGSVSGGDRYTLWISKQGDHVSIDMPPRMVNRKVHRLQTPYGSIHSKDRKFLEKEAVWKMKILNKERGSK